MIVPDEGTIRQMVDYMMLVEEHRALLDTGNTTKAQRTELRGTWIDWEWRYHEGWAAPGGWKHIPIAMDLKSASKLPDSSSS